MNVSLQLSPALNKDIGFGTAILNDSYSLPKIQCYAAHCPKACIKSVENEHHSRNFKSKASRQVYIVGSTF